MNQDHEKEGEENQEAGGLTEEQIDALSPGMCELEESPPQITKWDDSLYRELRRHVCKEPLDAIRMVQEVLLELKAGMVVERFSSHAFAFTQAVDGMLNLTAELAGLGYFEVVQEILPSFSGVLKSAKAWGSLENLKRNSIEQFHVFPILPEEGRWLWKKRTEALSWTHPELGEVWSEISYSGPVEKVAMASKSDPYVWDDFTTRFCMDESIHRHFGLHYLGIRSSRKGKRGPKKNVRIGNIAKFSWHCLFEVGGKRISAYYPQGHARGALVKKFVVMLVHGVFWNNGQTTRFKWPDIPPTGEEFMAYLGVPTIRPRCGDVKKWMSRIRPFLRQKVSVPEELTVFRTMLQLNEAVYLKAEPKNPVKLPLVEDKYAYQWNAIDRDIKQALRWYFKSLKSLPSQNIATFD